MASGGTWSFIRPCTPRHASACRAQAAENGVSVLDAPVSGGGPAAEQGALLVMVGGEAAVLDRVRPVLATFGDPILHLGDVGAGQTAKLVNNLVFTAQIALSLETFAFVDELGLDGAAMAQVFERGSGASRAATILSASGFDIRGLGRVAGPLLRKDVNLIADVARRQQVGAAGLGRGTGREGPARPRGRRREDLHERRHAYAADQRNRADRSCVVLRRRVVSRPSPTTASAPPRTRHGLASLHSPFRWTMRSGHSSPAPRASTSSQVRAGATLRVALDSTAFADLFCERRTALGLVIGGRVEGDSALERSLLRLGSGPPLTARREGASTNQATSRCRQPTDRRSISTSGSASARRRQQPPISSRKPGSSSSKTCSRRQRWMPSTPT